MLTWALLQEAISALDPVALALGAPIRRPVALARALLPALGAAGRAGAPAGPLVPVSVHCPARGRKDREPREHRRSGPCTLNPRERSPDMQRSRLYLCMLQQVSLGVHCVPLCPPSHLPGQSAMLQNLVCFSGPSQGLPPNWGGLQVRVRSRNPRPQVLEHRLQGDHSSQAPCTAGQKGLCSGIVCIVLPIHAPHCRPLNRGNPSSP